MRSHVEARSEALKTEWKGPEVDAPLYSAGGWPPTGPVIPSEPAC